MTKIIVPKNYVCPLSQILMIDPVSTIEGKIYEREAIEEWLQIDDTDPFTNVKLKNKPLLAMELLKIEILSFLENSKACSRKEFFSAVMSGDVNQFKKLNYLDTYLTSRIDQGRTALHYAAEHGFVEIVEMLLIDGADTEAKAAQDITPLHVAANLGREQVVKILLNAKANIEAKSDENKTALRYAVDGGHYDIVKLLLEANADVNAKDIDAGAAIHIAIMKGDAAILKLLIAAKANVNAPSIGGMTPLYLAVLYDNLTAVKLLLQTNARADLLIKADKGFTPWDIAKAKDNKAMLILMSQAAQKTLTEQLLNQQNKLPELIPLFKIKKEPQYIWYADKPLKLGGIPKKLSVDEFNKMIGGHYHYTENIYIDKQIKIDTSRLHNHGFMKEELLAIINNPDYYEKFVICYIDSNVGYGVFARRRIEIGEIVGVYSGEITSRKWTSDYGLALDANDYLHVDAANYGGVARFFQHLPLNVDNQINNTVKKLKKNPKLLERYLELTFAGDEISKRDRNIGMQQLRQDILQKNGQIQMRGMLLNGREKQWQLNRLVLKEKEILNQIAFSNVSTNFVTIDGKPLAYLWAEQSIEQDEQIGFDYGIEYWKWKKMLPLYFDTSGAVLAEENYSYKTIPFEVMLKDEKISIENKEEKILITNIDNNPNQKERELQQITQRFFKNPVSLQWKLYPEDRLLGKYIGHKVMFFTMKTEKTNATLFCDSLKKNGFDAELKVAKDNPSIVVDLTTSTPKLLI